jgi:5-methyltetrahydropteroyltriglutamate--homocysteine methyltransferase
VTASSRAQRPASLEPYRTNEFYPTDEAFVSALAEALRVEYEAIVDAGLSSADR